MARSRQSPQAAAGNLVQKWETQALCSLLPDVEDLSAPIADLEPDGKGIPILVRQYVKLGGKLLAFSVDPQFGNTLDGFVMVDLTRTSPEILCALHGTGTGTGVSCMASDIAAARGVKCARCFR